MQRAGKGVTSAIRKQMQRWQSAPGKHGTDVKCRESAGKKVSLLQYGNKYSKARENMHKVKVQTFGQADISLYMLLQLLTFIFKADLI